MLELYEAAKELGVEIYTGNIPNCVSFSLPGYIALDYNLMENGSLERSATAHELGHCARDAFYTRNDPSYIRKRCENKADKWAIKKLIPKNELIDAVHHGLLDPWELAEYFNVTEQLMRKAIWYYQYGNLAIPETNEL